MDGCMYECMYVCLLNGSDLRLEGLRGGIHAAAAVIIIKQLF